MRGKVVVITGGTSGIGQVAAGRLAEMGARIVLVARDKARADATLERLRRLGGDVEHTSRLADLSSIAATKQVAAEIAAAEPRIDVLINNAGALFNHRQLSPDGLEMTFAVNHMAYFVLTEGLRERLVTTPGARVVSTASGAHNGAKLDRDDLQSAKSYSGFAVYGRSKLCNILWTRELARRLAGTGVTANCLHPGLRRHPVRRRLGRVPAGLDAVGQADGDQPAKRRRDHRLSGFLAGGRRGYREILLSMQAARTEPGSPRRCARRVAVGSVGDAGARGRGDPGLRPDHPVDK